MRDLGLETDQFFYRGGCLSLGAGFQIAPQKDQRDDNGRAVVINMRRQSSLRKERRKKCCGGGISVGRKSTDGNQRIHVGCFLPRGFISAHKKTASHPQYSRSAQHKHYPEY